MSSHQVTRILELWLQHQSFQWVFRVDFPQDWLVWSPCCPRDSQESSPAPHFKGINSLALCLLNNPALTSVYDYWEDCWFSSVRLLSRVQLFATPWTAECQVSLSITSPWDCSNSCSSSHWCHPTISSSVVPFSYPQSFPASGSFQMSQILASGGQSIGISASTSVHPMNT